jgi:hypothetical protein
MNSDDAATNNDELMHHHVLEVFIEEGILQMWIFEE